MEGPADRLEPVPGRYRRTVLALLIITAMGGILRLLVADHTFPVQLVGDEHYYYKAALAIADGRGHVVEPEGWAFRPPAHSFLLSQIVAERGASSGRRGETLLRGFIRLEVALGTLLVPLAGLLGWSLFDSRTGVFSALTAALHPDLIAFSHYLWSETLFSILITAVLILVVRNRRALGWSAAVAAGVLCGVAALTREVAIPVGVAGCAWWFLLAGPSRRARVLACSALLLVAMVLVIAPWTQRNYSVLGRFVPVSNIGWFAAREGNTFSESSWLATPHELIRPFKRRYFSEMDDEMQRADMARSETLALIREEQPIWILRKTARTLAMLLTPDSYVFQKMSRSAYGDVPPLTRRIVMAFVLLVNGTVFCTGALGIAGARERGQALLVGLVLGVVFLLHLVANASPRFRIPWLPLWFAYSSYALVSWKEVRENLRGRRRVAAVGALVAIGAGSAAFFLPDALHLWAHGTYASP